MRITLPLPPSTNALSRAIVKGKRAVVISSKEYRSWKKDAHNWILIARPECLTGDVRVAMVIYYPDRRRDADSAIKPALDILQGHAYDNDRQVVEIHARACYGAEDPRVELIVEAAP